MRSLLVVCNTPTENTQSLFESVVRGTANKEITDIRVLAKQPLETTVDDVLQADGVIIGTTEHFGSMSGQIKDFFERIYYPCLEVKQGLPVAVYIKAALDGTGTQLGVEKILAGLRWKLVQPTLMLHGPYKTTFNEQCEQLGITMAAGLEANIF